MPSAPTWAQVCPSAWVAGTGEAHPSANSAGCQGGGEGGHLEVWSTRSRTKRATSVVRRGGCNRGVPGQDPAVGRGGVWCVEEPELRRSKAAMSATSWTPTCAQMASPSTDCMTHERWRSVATAASSHTRGRWRWSPIVVGRGRDHAVDHRSGEAHLLGNERRQPRVDLLRGLENPGAQDAAVVEEIVQREAGEDRRRQAGLPASGQSRGDQCRRGRRRRCVLLAGALVALLGDGQRDQRRGGRRDRLERQATGPVVTDATAATTWSSVSSPGSRTATVKSPSWGSSCCSARRLRRVTPRINAGWPMRSSASTYTATWARPTRRARCG